MPALPDRWGTWGPQDERGALNDVDARATLRAIGTVRSGRTLSLGLPIRSGHGPVAPGRALPQHFMRRDGGDYAAGRPERGFAFADDSVVLAVHGTTHLDALAHVWVEHRMWNDHSADFVTSSGAARCGIEKAGPIVTRAIVLDLVAPTGPVRGDDHVITEAELAAALADSGVEPVAGDALLVRTGWLARWHAGTATPQQCAGLGVGCAAWIQRHGFAVVGCDNVMVEASPAPGTDGAAPLHIQLIRNRGIYLLELVDLDELAAAHRPEVMLMIAPLNLVGGTGSPVAPIAVL